MAYSPYGTHLWHFVVFASSGSATLRGDIRQVCVFHSGRAAVQMNIQFLLLYTHAVLCQITRLICFFFANFAF